MRRVTHADHNCLLDGGAVGSSRELAVNEDARGEVHLALECFMVELVRESCWRHYCWGIAGGVAL